MAQPVNYHLLIKAATVQAIKDLALDKIGTRVFDHMWPDESGVQFPCIMVSAEGMTERNVGGTTIGPKGAVDFFEFPVRVFIADIRSRREHEQQGPYFQWRRTIAGRFSDRAEPLGTSGELRQVRSCRVEFNVVFDQKLPQYDHIVSALELWFWTAIPRNP